MGGTRDACIPRRVLLIRICLERAQQRRQKAIYGHDWGFEVARGRLRQLAHSKACSGRRRNCDDDGLRVLTVALTRVEPRLRARAPAAVNIHFTMSVDRRHKYGDS